MEWFSGICAALNAIKIKNIFSYRDSVQIRKYNKMAGVSRSSYLLRFAEWSLEYDLCSEHFVRYHRSRCRLLALYFVANPKSNNDRAPFYRCKRLETFQAFSTSANEWKIGRKGKIHFELSIFEMYILIAKNEFIYALADSVRLITSFPRRVAKRSQKT